MNVPSSAICPRCGNQVAQVIGGHVVISVPGGTDRHGIAYACSGCRACLGVEMDPIALRTEIVAQVVKALKG